jgi:Flp pilus assembly protein TadG
LLMPLMVLMFFGTVELTQGFAASRKLTYLARDLADLTSQTASSTITSSDTTNTFGVASSVFYPFVQPNMTLTGIVFKTGSDTLVHAYTDWSIIGPNGGTLRACGELQRTSAAGNAPPAVPDAFFVAGTTIIAADVSYDYMPLIGSTFMAIGSNGANLGSGTLAKITMRETSYMQPRSQTRVQFSGTAACPNVTFP